MVNREPSDVTVVITPPGSTETERIGQIMTSWSEAGFVRRFLWWDGEDDNQHRVVWSDSPDTPLPLLDVLAAAPYDVVRLVSLLPIADPAAPVPTDLPELSARVEDLVARRLAPGQHLAQLGLVVPASDVARIPRAVLSSRWHSTVVVVDEDSVDPSHASRDVRDPEHFAAHAALALATAAGLWSGMDSGPFDRDNEAAGQQEPRLRLIRCHARAGRAYGLSDDIIRETLTHRTDPAWVAEMLGARPAENSGYLANRAGDEFLAGPGRALTRTPFQPPRRRKARMTPRAAFHLLWLFMRGRVAELQQELRRHAVNEVQDRIESVTQRAVFGSDSDVEVRFDGRPLDTDDAGETDAASIDVARMLIEAVNRPVAPWVFPTEWRALRELSFGLADAGPLPEGCTEPRNGVHRQVVSVAAVCPPPNEPDLDDEEPESMLVRIGRRIASDTETTRQAFLRALETLKNSLPGKPAQTPADRRYWFIWLAITLLTTIGLAMVISLYTNNIVNLRDTIYLCASLVLIFLLASGLISFLFLRKEFQEANKANRIWDQYETARLAAEHEAKELIRLSAANSTYKQWLPILTRILHVANSDTVTTAPDTADLETLVRPSAFAVGRTETQPRVLTRLAAIIGRRTFQAGWLSALYARILADCMGELKFRRGLPTESPDPDPDVETTARSELSTRTGEGRADETLINDVRTIVSEQTSHLDLAELFHTVHPVGAEATLTTTFLGTLHHTAGERASRFNRRLWTESSGYPTVATQTRNWLPDRLILTDGSPSATILPATMRSDNRLMVVLSARLDQTEPLVWSQLALFSANDPEPDHPTAQAETVHTVW